MKEGGAFMVNTIVNGDNTKWKFDVSFNKCEIRVLCLTTRK